MHTDVRVISLINDGGLNHDHASASVSAPNFTPEQLCARVCVREYDIGTTAALREEA